VRQAEAREEAATEDEERVVFCLPCPQASADTMGVKQRTHAALHTVHDRIWHLHRGRGVDSLRYRNM